MIQLSEEELLIIDKLIELKQTFSIYKKPYEDDLHFVMQGEGEPELIGDLSLLNGKSGYVIAPFHLSEKYPAVLLHPDRFRLPSLEEVEKMSRKGVVGAASVPILAVNEMQEAYKERFADFLEQLKRGALQKVVLSRHQTEKSEHSSVAKAFLAACMSYENAYVYLVSTPQTGVWMGSTPEMLLKGKNKAWQTVALAGTQLYHEGKIEWDAKNIEEQAVVVRYVKAQLEQFGITPSIQGPSNIKAGNIVHLVSHFNFEMEDTSRLGDLLKLLHPTPAVCGFPKESSYRFILDNEKQERKYYAGFIGDINTDNGTSLYVNLRCMELFDHAYTLFAGGGLLSSSVLEQEWSETVRKMETMKALFSGAV